MAIALRAHHHYSDRPARQLDQGSDSGSDSGGGATSSEYIHDLIRREQYRVARLNVVRVALIEDEGSGLPQVFDAQAFKLDLK